MAIKDLEKKYVAVQYDNHTQQRLRNWCEQYEFDLSVKFDGSPQRPEDFDFHTTIFFTTTLHSDPNGVYQLDRWLDPQVWVTGMEWFGENKDVPVLKVYGNSINMLRHRFETNGYMDAWPDYKPHVSLSYDRRLNRRSDIKLPNFPLVVDHYVIKKAAEL